MSQPEKFQPYAQYLTKNPTVQVWEWIPVVRQGTNPY